ncbi:MAG TPA: hypothetical protein VFT43_06215, partial [Candidatus Polarisedimenticolia bacterium]|nr:hypothetical protein [Candidatus Polarisedimenticolia bacterium]
VMSLVVASTVIGAGMVTAAADDEATVMVSRPGVVFHRAGSSDLRGRGFEKTVSQALAAGYVPCRVCFASNAALSRVASGTAAGGAAAASGQSALSTGTTTSSTSTSSSYAPPRLRGLDKGVIRDPYADPVTATGRIADQSGYTK